MPITCSNCVRPKEFSDLCASGLESNSCDDAIIEFDANVTSFPEICAWCGGACCHENMLEATPSAYLTLYKLPNEDDRCPGFDSKTGCVLPREGRPVICLEFRCTLVKSIQNDPVMWQHCQTYGRVSGGMGTFITCRDCPHDTDCRYIFRTNYVDIHADDPFTL